MHEVTNSNGLNIVDSLGYALCTRAVIKNIVTHVEVGDQSKACCCSMNKLYFAAGTRQPFRDAYFGISGLFTQKIVEGCLWSGVTLIRALICLKISKSWSLAKEGFIMALSNLACLGIASLGMCRPRWGVSLWFYMTKKIFNCAGEEIITNLTRGIIIGFEHLYPALVYNLGSKETFGLDETCSSLRKNLVKIASALEDLQLWKDTKEARSLKQKTLKMFSELISYTKNNMDIDQRI